MKIKRTFNLNVKTGKTTKKYRTGKLGRFVYFTRLIKWQIKGIKVYLKVNYGKQKDNYNKLREFYNDGNYFNKEDFNLTYKAFIER